MKSEKITAKSWALLVFLSLVWGASFILNKRGLLFLSPLEVGMLRITSAAVFLAPFTLFPLRKIRSISKSNFFYLFLSGVLGGLIPFVLIPVAQTKIESGIAGVLNSTTPIFVLLVSWLFFKVKPRPLNFLGLGFGIIGILFLNSKLADSDSFINIFQVLNSLDYYAFFVLLATLSYAVNINLVKFKIKNLSSLTLTGVSFISAGIISTICLLLFTPFLENLIDFSETKVSIIAIVIQGVVNTALAMIIFNKIISKTNPLFAGSVTYIIPIVSIFLGILDGETISLHQSVGMVIILLGVFLINKKTKKPNLK